MNKALSRGEVSAAKGHILIEMQHLNFPASAAAESTFSLGWLEKKKSKLKNKPTNQQQSFWFMERVVFLKFLPARSCLDPTAAQ